MPRDRSDESSRCRNHFGDAGRKGPPLTACAVECREISAYGVGSHHAKPEPVAKEMVRLHTTTDLPTELSRSGDGSLDRGHVSGPAVDLMLEVVVVVIPHNYFDLYWIDGWVIDEPIRNWADSTTVF